jgi:hypothetical protein
MARYFDSEVHALTADLLRLVENGPDGIRVRAGASPGDAGIAVQRLQDQIDRDQARGTLTRRAAEAPMLDWRAAERAARLAAEVREIRLPPFNPPPDGLKFIDLSDFIRE